MRAKMINTMNTLYLRLTSGGGFSWATLAFSFLLFIASFIGMFVKGFLWSELLLFLVSILMILGYLRLCLNGLEIEAGYDD